MAHRIITCSTIAAIILILFLIPLAPISAHTSQDSSITAAPADLHEPFDILLRLYVEGTRFNYQAIAANEGDRARLEAYVARLESLNPGNWNGNDALAYWINMYNAATLELILKHYPVNSIKDIGGFFSSPWNEDVVVVAGNPLTLNQIENEIIRPKFKDARIHFALNCASISCPPLANFAYVGESIDEQLDQAVKNVLNNDLVIEMSSEERWIDFRDNKIYVTKIFDWYKEDFAVDGGVRKFIAEHRPQDEALLLDEKNKLKYMDYNWDLNRVERETVSR